MRWKETLALLGTFAAGAVYGVACKGGGDGAANAAEVRDSGGGGGAPPPDSTSNAAGRAVVQLYYGSDFASCFADTDGNGASDAYTGCCPDGFSFVGTTANAWQSNGTPLFLAVCLQDE
jgi:hypothetical protein